MTFEAANLVMLYLLGVVIVTLVYDHWPSVLAVMVNAISFDLFFVTSRGTLTVSDVQCLSTFGVILTMGLLIDNLTAGVRYQVRVARYREHRIRYLYEMSKVLAVGRSQQSIATTSERFVTSTFQTHNQLLLPDAQGKLLPLTRQLELTAWDDVIARWNFDKGQPINAGTDILPGVPYRILPLKSAIHTQGLLAVEPENLRQLMIPERQRLLETFTLSVASVLERLTLTAGGEQARSASERKSLRDLLLTVLSHDLCTPLAVLFGQAEILALSLTSEGSKRVPQTNEIHQHILDTTRLMSNLLGVARTQSDGFSLHKEWLMLEGVIDNALRMLEPSLGGQHIQLDPSDSLQLVHVDGPLFEWALINLLESAHKCISARANVGIRAKVDAWQLSLEVWGNGPEILAGQKQTIFNKFTRGNKESAIPGVGLDLAICQTITDVHGGTASANSRPENGTSFRVTLPGETPPELKELPEKLWLTS